MDNELDILKDIKRVQAPVDIYDNIQASLVSNDKLSKNWLWAIATAFIILVCVELYLCKASFFQSEDVSTLADSYHVSSNQLYHE